MRNLHIICANLTEEIMKDKYIYSAAKTIVRGGLNIIWGHFPHYF